MTQEIRTRRDGSIDTTFYMRQGRKARSAAAADLARRATLRRGLLTAVISISGLAWLLDTTSMT